VPAGRRSAAEYGQKTRPGLSLGLHLTSEKWSNQGRGNWTPVYNVVPLDEVKACVTKASRQLWPLPNFGPAETPAYRFSTRHAHLAEPARFLWFSEAVLRTEDPVARLQPEVALLRNAFNGQTAKGFGPSPEGESLQTRDSKSCRKLQPGIRSWACTR